jgi:hypothetical protein
VLKVRSQDRGPAAATALDIGDRVLGIERRLRPKERPADAAADLEGANAAVRLWTGLTVELCDTLCGITSH